ncbi:MAG TPA: hypothetical protein VNN08_00475 [Thermoanaerobaculia bacterium]|nr:hypothetical protein [Thermoanaerobaculia bacterium]
MSVLSFPRIYFKGYMEWDPCTFNNNDWAAFTTYDPVNAALNWDFLAQFNITRENFRTTFRPWAITLLPDNKSGDPDPGTLRVPCEWNMFGTHAVSFVQYNNYVSQVTGGDFGDGTPVDGDPIIGGQVTISGDRGNGPARLVDTNPASPWSSQIYWGGFTIGSGNASFSGPRQVRMHSRWLNPFRMYTAGDALLAPASGIGVTFQTAIPNGKVNWPAPGTSPLITKLKAEAEKPGALGIMIRFAGYVNAYFSNGIFNSSPKQPRNYTDLAAYLNAAWETWYAGGADPTSNFFSNPCYSHIVGVVGVWKEGELASVPGGRCLNGNAQIAPLQTIASSNRPSIVGHQVLAVSPPPATVLLGPVAAEIDYYAKRISLDLSATMPELGVTANSEDNLSKADFGPLHFGAINSKGKFERVASIDYAQYARNSYENTAGIIDIPFPGEHTGAILRDGTLAITVMQNNQPQTALLEEQFTAETDERGIYLDDGEAASFEITVCENGVPAAGVNVAVARYSGFAKTAMQASNLPIIAVDQPRQVNFTNGTLNKITVPNPNTPPTPPNVETEITIVTTGTNCKATVGISAQSPGFPVLGFYPYRGALPEGLVANSFNFIDNAYYTTVRVLPFDSQVPQAFVDLWNKNQKRNEAWHFIYHEILYLYDMLFNVMLEFVNLGSLESVEGHIKGIWSLIAKDMTYESTMAMPITRDMSAGKRLTLQLWIYLVWNKYNVPGFNVGSIPAGWSPGK